MIMLVESYWIFAHNGDVPSAKDPAWKGMSKTAITRYRPVGETDSEAIFCYFLNHLLGAFPNGKQSELRLPFGLSLRRRSKASFPPTGRGVERMCSHGPAR